MALILNIETATDVCSVALAENGHVKALREQQQGQSHARILTTFISECCEEAGKKLSELDAVAVSKGPGSFTGLRIGVATAKGLCYAMEKPLIAVNTLHSMASHYSRVNNPDPGKLLCPMIDARRMEVYTAVFNSNLEFIHDTSAEILTATSFSELLAINRVEFFGDGAIKFRHYIENQSNATLDLDFLPSASGMAPLSENSYVSKNFETTAYFEPFYLKDFYSQSGKR